MGRGPVPWTAIDQFASRYGIDDPDEYERFVGFIRSLDQTYLAWHGEKE